MNTPHQDFQKAKEELIDLLKHHEAVLAFQEAEGIHWTDSLRSVIWLDR